MTRGLGGTNRMLLLVLAFTLCRTTTCYCRTTTCYLPTPWREPPRSAYVHIPFCRRRCSYCDFPIVPIGDRPGAAEGASEPYVELLLREIAATARTHGERTRAAGGLATIFFGGGTPSLLPPRELDALLAALDAAFGLAPGAEISAEMDPGTFDDARLRAFVTAGVNRVSLGVQSFDDDLLRACGRSHSAADAHDAIARVQHSRVERFSVDLMTGLPGLTKALWHATLETALATGTPHMAVYDLQVEDGTAFARRYEPGVAPLPTEDACASMLRDAAHALGAAGLQRYEVSNFARAGFECAHNACYWANKPHLAFGNGAARCRRSFNHLSPSVRAHLMSGARPHAICSFIDGHRFSRPRSIRDYEQWLDTYEVESRTSTSEGDSADGLIRHDWLLDSVMVRRC